MNRQEQDAIEELFTKLEQVERQAPPRDPEAEALIQRRLTEQPGAAYFMAQTIIVQEQALAAANAQPAQRPEALQQPAADPGRRSPWGAPRGGFFAGAAQTALGVTGGLLLGNAVLGMFGGDEAQAATPEPEPVADDPAPEPEAAADDGGGFFDDFGDW